MPCCGRYFHTGYCRDGEACRFAHSGGRSAAPVRLPCAPPPPDAAFAPLVPSVVAATAGGFAFGAPGAKEFSGGSLRPASAMGRAASDGAQRGASPAAGDAGLPPAGCGLLKSVSAAAAAMGAAAEAAAADTGPGGAGGAAPDANAELARRSDLAPTARPFLPVGLGAGPEHAAHWGL